ncbi:YihY/virulence factor BrkB family protein [Halobacterium jilantaiense]|uniref:YihY family inner membrane protein n=1 Tax=Halobacterium jilantaiense TaxID=355548 RepID=A0A1I0Q2G0_9EURY|nr:YihY/virulence factor BrkB family protein [Halobacterium jilantaiense]SEW21070.1 YihY family inner membrane protein [Halobacterium jilantaiense]
MTRLRRAAVVARQTATGARDEQVTFLAAAIAYYAFVSIVPLVLLGVTVGQALGGDALVEEGLRLTDEFLSGTGQQAVRNAVTNTEGRASATVVSVALLAWSGLKLFRGLDVAFSQIYGVEGSEGLVDQLKDASVVLVTIPVAVVVAAGIGIAAPVLGLLPFANVTSVASLVVVLSVLFLPAYYVFPDVGMTLQNAVPGAVFGAVGWTALVEGFRVYAQTASLELYGVLGGALLFVTFLYFGGIIITVGAVFNAVLSGRTDDNEDDTDSGREPPDEAPDVAALGAEVAALREELDAKTVSRDDLEADLRQYVRARQRRGKARGWGPYLVLLYGTGMTVAAFAYLSGGWAILAMLVVWLSTLGLYTLMVLFGIGVNAVGLPGKVADRVRSWRS